MIRTFGKSIHTLFPDIILQDDWLSQVEQAGLVLDKHEELLLARVLDPNFLLLSSGDGRMNTSGVSTSLAQLHTGEGTGSDNLLPAPDCKVLVLLARISTQCRAPSSWGACAEARGITITDWIH